MRWICCRADIDEEAVAYAQERLRPSDALAEECVSDPVLAHYHNQHMMGLEVKEIPTTIVVVDSKEVPTDELRGIHLPSVAKCDITTEEEKRNVRSVVAPHVTLQSGTSVVQNTRQVDAKKSGAYIQSVVAEVKNRFGSPERTPANVLSVRRFANDVMQRHGLRPTHVAQNLPMVVALTFMKSDTELEADYVTLMMDRAVAAEAGYSRFRKLVHWVTGRSPSRQWY